MIDLRSRYPVKPPPNTYGRRALSAITTVVYHHSTGQAPTDEVAARRLLDVIGREHVQVRSWPGIGYHYAVAPSGDIYWLNDWETVSYHVMGHNEETIGLCFLGDYEQSQPTDAALWAAARLHFDLENQLGRVLRIVGHAELNPASTAFCPSKRWQDWKPILVRRIREDPRVRVLPYLDTAWGKSERIELGTQQNAIDLDELAALLRRAATEIEAASERDRKAALEAAQIRDYLLLIKRGVGLV